MQLCVGSFAVPTIKAAHCSLEVKAARFTSFVRVATPFHVCVFPHLYAGWQSTHSRDSNAVTTSEFESDRVSAFSAAPSCRSNRCGV